MKALIVFDSAYGNTEKIARAIGAAITGEAKVLRAGEADVAELNLYDLLIIGSPTQGGKPMPTVVDLLNKIPESEIKSKNVAVFDTRVPTKIVKLFGFAGDKIAKNLKEKGANVIVPVEGFLVAGTKGPLKEGELEHVTNWVKTLIK